MYKHILTHREKDELYKLNNEIKEINEDLEFIEKRKNEVIKNILFITWGFSENDILIDKEKKTRYVVCFTPDYFSNTIKGYVYLGLAPLQKSSGKAFNNFRYLTEDFLSTMVKSSEKYTGKIYNYQK